MQRGKSVEGKIRLKTFKTNPRAFFLNVGHPEKPILHVIRIFMISFLMDFYNRNVHFNPFLID
jgi:hypothetical protein